MGTSRKGIQPAGAPPRGRSSGAHPWRLPSELRLQGPERGVKRSDTAAPPARPRPENSSSCTGNLGSTSKPSGPTAATQGPEGTEQAIRGLGLETEEGKGRGREDGRSKGRRHKETARAARTDLRAVAAMQRQAAPSQTKCRASGEKCLIGGGRVGAAVGGGVCRAWPGLAQAMTS